MKKLYITIAALIGLAACQMAELDKFETADPQKDDQQKLMLKSLLTGRDTRWTVDDLAIPSEENGWKLISNDKELAFLLEFGSVSGEKYRLTADINLAGSLIEEKLAGEIGVENFENFEFDGNGKTISGLNVPLAAGLFSRVKDSKIYNFTLNSCTVGDQENVSNTLGTGMVIGSASGTVEVSDVTVSECNVCAPCKVGGLAGSIIDATCTFTSCQVKNTDVATIYRKGISGWCGGFIGFVGRSEEKSGEVTVKVDVNQCVLNGGTVKAHKESDTRGVGIFLGALNGFDSKESFTMTGCTVNTTFTGLDTNASKHPNYLIGAHKYMNGIILIDGSTYAFPWDGVTKTQPVLSDGAYHVYTAEELAWFQGRTESNNKILIHRDIDLGGYVFAPIYKANHIDGAKADGSNSEIRNLKVVRTNCGKEDGGAFIRQASGTTVHKNITFRNADIKATHDPNADHGNAYCATLCGNMVGTYTMENVHAYDGKIYGVNKMGGLLGRVYATATIADCSVSGYTIENYTVTDKPETFEGTAEKSGMTITASATFYPHGEIGGMIGFVQGKADITKCNVNSTTIRATGQADAKADLTGSSLAVLAINAAGGFLVPGRHVSALIGDIRTGNSSTGFPVVVSNCSIGSDVIITPTWDQHSTSAKYIGQCYYVYSKDNSGGSVTVDGTSQTIKHCVSW